MDVNRRKIFIRYFFTKFNVTAVFKNCIRIRIWIRVRIEKSSRIRIRKKLIRIHSLGKEDPDGVGSENLVGIIVESFCIIRTAPSRLK